MSKLSKMGFRWQNMNSGGTTTRPGDPSSFEITGPEMELIRLLLAQRTGFSLHSYKDNCIKRRINIRIRATRCQNTGEYCRLLEQDDREVLRLFKVLTIHVSHFFRNPSVYQKLCADVIPSILENAGKEKREATFWSVGCSTGEEPYSLALLLKENFSRRMEQVPVRIIGTDINAEILAAARKGTYSIDRLAEIPGDMLERNFVSENGLFYLKSGIRSMVEFIQSDLFSGEPFPASDLILFRNVQIYFERKSQEELLKRFANVLSQEGFLVLGKSETLVGESRRLFRTLSPAERIYKVVKSEA